MKHSFDVEYRQFTEGHLDVVVRDTESQEEVATFEVRRGQTRRHCAITVFAREGNHERTRETKPSDPPAHCFRTHELEAILP